MPASFRASSRSLHPSVFIVFSLMFPQLYGCLRGITSTFSTYAETSPCCNFFFCSGLSWPKILHVPLGEC
jgi:hypothetical protein